jgi:alpha-1,3-rhamnosyl/mannosyltransferase
MAGMQTQTERGAHTTHCVLDARTATDHFPGIGRYVINLARALPQVAPSLPLSLLCDPVAPTMRLPLPGLPHILCPDGPFSLRQQWSVPRQLHQQRATLYHSPYYLMPYRANVPTVLTVYDLIPLIFPRYFSAAQRVIYRGAHHLALRAARVILAISQATKSDLIHYFHVVPERIVVTPLAADDHFHPQPPAAIAAMRRKYGLSDSYLLYVGSNKPHKNLARLVRAFSQFTFAPPTADLQLVLAGPWDPRYPQAKKSVVELGLQGRVLFLPDVPEEDLPALYSGAMVFVFPSEYEGFGLPVLEAMACGAPAICSGASSLPEVAGNAAIAIDPADVSGLFAAISRLLGDDALRQEMKERGLAQAARFSWRRTAQETASAYRTMMQAG